MKILKIVAKEPLTQFLIFGAILYVFYVKTVPNFTQTQLVVTKNDLITYMQYQANSFDQPTFEARYAALTEAEKQQLLANYTEGEVLIKEAKKLNLQENDNVIRNRLIQKMKFLLKNETAAEPTEADLKTFYDSHKTQYSSSEKYSFTHVFFSFENHPEADALKLTNDFIEKTKKQFINAEQALSFSERYPYFHNYTQRDLGFIESNFDANFAQILRGLSVDKTQWQGAIKSNLGYHAVLLIGKEADKIKSFDEVKVLGAMSMMCGLILDTVVRGRLEVRRLAYLGYPAPGAKP